MRKRAAARESDVLNALHAYDRPITAYQVLKQLQLGEPAIAPPTVYRTLSAPPGLGRAHRLETINTFVHCRCRHTDSVPVLTIFETCGSVGEHDESELFPRLVALTDLSAFGKRHIIESHGQCEACAA